MNIRFARGWGIWFSEIRLPWCGQVWFLPIGFAWCGRIGFLSIWFMRCGRIRLGWVKWDLVEGGFVVVGDVRGIGFVVIGFLWGIGVSLIIRRSWGVGLALIIRRSGNIGLALVVWCSWRVRGWVIRGVLIGGEIGGWDAWRRGVAMGQIEIWAVSWVGGFINTKCIHPITSKFYKLILLGMFDCPLLVLF